jgi:hypothetical protein
MIDLDFDDASEAQAYLAALQRTVYSSREASLTSGNPQTRIVEVVEAKESTDASLRLLAYSPNPVEGEFCELLRLSGVLGSIFTCSAVRMAPTVTTYYGFGSYCNGIGF